MDDRKSIVLGTFVAGLSALVHEMSSRFAEKPFEGIRGRVFSGGPLKYRNDSGDVVVVPTNEDGTFEIAMGPEYHNISGMFSVTDNSGVVFEISYMNLPNVASVSVLFSGCTGLQSVNMRGCDLSSAGTAGSMFDGCTSLAIVDMRDCDMSAVTSTYRMFIGCENLSSLKLEGAEFGVVTDAESMFESCKLLPSVDLTCLKKSRIDSADKMFRYCEALTAVDFSPVDFSALTSMERITEGSKIGLVDMHGKDFSSLKNAKDSFTGSKWVTLFDFSGCKFPALLNCTRMFNICQRTTKITFAGATTGNALATDSMFQNCYALKELDLSAQGMGLTTSWGASSFMMTGELAKITCDRASKNNLKSILGSRSDLKWVITDAVGMSQSIMLPIVNVVCSLGELPTPSDGGSGLSEEVRTAYAEALEQYIQAIDTAEITDAVALKVDGGYVFATTNAFGPPIDGTWYLAGTSGKTYAAPSVSSLVVAFSDLFDPEKERVYQELATVIDSLRQRVDELTSKIEEMQ